MSSKFVEYGRYSCGPLGLNPLSTNQRGLGMDIGAPPGPVVRPWPLHRWPAVYLEYLDRLFVYIAARIQDERAGFSPEEVENPDLLCRVRFVTK